MPVSAPGGEHPSAPQLCLLVVLGETEPPSQFWGCTAMPGAEERGGAMLTSPCCLQARWGWRLVMPLGVFREAGICGTTCGCCTSCPSSEIPLSPQGLLVASDPPAPNPGFCSCTWGGPEQQQQVVIVGTEINPRGKHPPAEMDGARGALKPPSPNLSLCQAWGSRLVTAPQSQRDCCSPVWVFRSQSDTH